MTFLCTRCDAPIHQTPFICNDHGAYTMFCTEQCVSEYQEAMNRLKLVQRGLWLGMAAWNGA
jgi:hypothetical protein